MTITQWVTLIEELIKTAGSLATFFVLIQQFRNRKTHLAVAADVAVVKADVADVKRETNHMKDELVASTAKASHAEGVADRRAVEDEAAVQKAL